VYFRCKGSTQHLKSTYGGGYVLEADVEPSTADIFDDDAIATQQKRVNELICGRLFVDARCTEQFGRHCVYQIPRTSVQRLSEVFSALQQSKTTLFSLLACNDESRICLGGDHGDCGKQVIYTRGA